MIEQDFDPLPPEQLTVWNDEHPAPKAADPQFERDLVAWLTKDAQQQLRAASPPKGLDNVLRPAVEVLIGRTYDDAGDVRWAAGEQEDRGEYVKHTGTLLNKTHSEEVDVLWLRPKQWTGRVVVWLDETGKTAVCDGQNNVPAAVQDLVQAGTAVLGADLHRQGGEGVEQTGVVENPREFAGYTFGYNHALFA